jgi:hypothetical protein
MEYQCNTNNVCVLDNSRKCNILFINWKILHPHNNMKREIL